MNAISKVTGILALVVAGVLAVNASSVWADDYIVPDFEVDPCLIIDCDDPSPDPGLPPLGDIDPCLIIDCDPVPPVDPCLLDPAGCLGEPPLDPCLVNPADCLGDPPIEPCLVNPTLCPDPGDAPTPTATATEEPPTPTATATDVPPSDTPTNTPPAATPTSQVQSGGKAGSLPNAGTGDGAALDSNQALVILVGLGAAGLLVLVALYVIVRKGRAQA